MEVKSKMKIISFAIAAGFFVAALVLFFLAPIVVEPVGELYSGATSLLGGAKLLFSFTFDSGKYLMFFIAFCLVFVCYLWWMIVIIIRKKWKSFIWFGITFALVLVNVFALASYVIAPDGTKTVLKQVFELDGSLIGKAFVAAVLVFFFFGLMFATLCAYSDILQSLEARAHEKSAEEEEIRQMAKEEAERVYNEERNRILQEEIDMSVYEDKLNLKRHRESNDDYYENLINELPMFRKRRGQVEPKKEVVRPVEQPKPAPAPVVAPKPAPAPVAPAKEVVPFERISFAERLGKSEKVVKEHYNELKSEILSYGIKSRVSNSGDTFRLHTKTYVKMVVAGKALKLYFALDPKAYADSTFPVGDASKKGLYKEIPLVFKVKSELSVRRAKQLIAEAAGKDGLVQGEVEAHDWAKELK